jgi:predicted branched-subunit amino acid permease
MQTENKSWFLRGMRDGVPIGLGYLAVAFTLGIAARNAGLTAFQATLTSLLVNASAGQYAAFTMMAANSGFLELAIMEAVTNARYILMSCALSQKLPSTAKLWQRMTIGFNVNDEIFGMAIAEPDKLNPYYYFGMMAIAMPGWALGTFLGTSVGNILTASAVSALSVGLYGMFLAVIIPASKKSKIILGVVIVSMAASFAMEVIPVFGAIASGTRTIILTVVIASAAAILFPVKEEEKEEADHGA